MEQDALEKAKERLKSNYSKARSARHGAQLCQPAPAPRPRAAPPRQTEAPTLSPALRAQGWAVKQSRSTGGYYYVHTANGREWSQWEPPVAPERRSSPERAAAALFSDEDDDDSASDSEDEMPVSALLARQATANDAAIAQALAGSPAKRSRKIGGVGGRRHGKKRREPVVVPAAAEDDDESSVWSQSSLSDSSNPPSPTYAPPSPTYESVMESGGIDYESGFLDDENPAPAGRGRGAIKPAWMTRGALVDDDFRPLGSRAVLAAPAPAPRPPPRPSAATPRPWRNPYAAEAAATSAPRGWRNPYAETAGATHVITPEGAQFGQTPRWAPPTPWSPPVLPVRTQSEPWTSPQQWSQPPRGPAFSPYGHGGYTPAPPRPGGYTPAPPVDYDADFDGAEFSGDEGETPSVKAGRAAERRTGTIERIPPRAPWRPASGSGQTAPAFAPPAEPKRSPRGAARGSRSPPARSAPAFAPPGSEPAPAPVANHGLPDAIARLDEDALTYLLQNEEIYESLFVGGELDTNLLRDAVAAFRTPVGDAAELFISGLGPKTDSMQLAQYFETRYRKWPTSCRVGRGAWGKGIGFVTLDSRAAAIVLDAAARNASYHRVEGKVVVVRRVADAARVDELCDHIQTLGANSIDAGGLVADLTEGYGEGPKNLLKKLVRAHGGDKLRWVDVGPHGRVVVVGAGRSSEEAAPPPTPSFLGRPAAATAAPAPDLAPSSTGFSAEGAATPKAPSAIPAPPDEKPRHCRICGEAFNVGWSATENLWILEGCVAASVDNGSTALVHAGCRAAAGDVIEAAALIPDPSAPTLARAVSPPPPSAARTINDATVAARTKHILAEDDAIRAEYGDGSLTVRTLRAAVAKALGVEEAVVKKVVRATLMAQIAADNKPPEEDAAASAPAPAGASDDWGSASFGMASPAPAPAPARKSRFDVPAPAPAAIADVAAPEPDFGARLAARAERFGAKAAPTGQRDRSRRRSRSRERSRRRDKKRRGGDIYVPPPRRQERR